MIIITDRLQELLNVQGKSGAWETTLIRKYVNFGVKIPNAGAS